MTNPMEWKDPQKTPIPGQEKPEISPSTEKLPDFKNVKPDGQKRIIMESLDKVAANEHGYFHHFDVCDVIKEKFYLNDEDYGNTSYILSELENEGKLERWPMGRGPMYKIKEK